MNKKILGNLMTEALATSGVLIKNSGPFGFIISLKTDIYVWNNIGRKVQRQDIIMRKQPGWVR